MAKVQVRYIVNDIDTTIAFYTKQLGFNLEMRPAPAFAMLSLGDLRLVLSQPNPSDGGGQTMPGGAAQTPGGWNRFAILVNNISQIAEDLKKTGVHFRSDIIVGVGGKQVIIDDPSGNPIELFEPLIPDARMH